MRERKAARAESAPGARSTWNSFERLCRRLSPDAWRRADVQARAMACLLAETERRQPRVVIAIENDDDAAAERHWASRVLRG